MSDFIIDACGLSCPQPVVLTQKAIKDGKESFTIKVDSVVSKENIIRCVCKYKMKCEITEEGDEIIINVKK